MTPRTSTRLPPRRQAVLAARLAGILLVGIALPRALNLLGPIFNVIDVEALGGTGYIGGLAKALSELDSHLFGLLAVSGAMLIAGLFLLFARGPAFWFLLRRFPA